MADPVRIRCYSLLLKAMSKRRTWVSLFLLAYALLLSSSWNLILAIRAWHISSSSSATSPESLRWPAIYASVLYGGVFGVLSMAAALAIAVPATVVTWITVVVLLAFAGKPRRTLVIEGRRITAEIVRFSGKILLMEGNLVAGFCVVVSFVVLMLRRGRQWRENEDL